MVFPLSAGAHRFRVYLSSVESTSPEHPSPMPMRSRQSGPRTTPIMAKVVEPGNGDPLREEETEFRAYHLDLVTLRLP